MANKKGGTVMDNNSKNDFSVYNDKIFEELYIMNSLINIAKSSCQELEFNGQYYGIPSSNRKKLSDERFGYINIFTLLSDKLANIKNLSLNIESAISLQNNTHNRSR